jgi:uncharacterized membrane protein YkoI
LLCSSQALALGKSDIRSIIEKQYPGARVTEIDKETYKNKKVYEVDFLHQGKRLEAVITFDGTIIKVETDD